MSADCAVSSAYASLTQYSMSMSSQAVAASWAGFCSHASKQIDLQADFCNLQIFLSTQSGLSHCNNPAAQLQYPPGLHGLTPLESAFSKLLDRRGITFYPRPGGWSVLEVAAFAYTLKDKHSKQHRALEKRLYDLSQGHVGWLEGSVKPSLQG